MRKSPQHVRGWCLPEARLVGQGDKRTPISSSAIQRIDRGVHPFFGFVARQAGGELSADVQGDGARMLDEPIIWPPPAGTERDRDDGPDGVGARSEAVRGGEGGGGAE